MLITNNHNLRYLIVLISNYPAVKYLLLPWIRHKYNSLYSSVLIEDTTGVRGCLDTNRFW